DPHDPHQAVLLVELATSQFAEDYQESVKPNGRVLTEGEQPACPGAGGLCPEFDVTLCVGEGLGEGRRDEGRGVRVGGLMAVVGVWASDCAWLLPWLYVSRAGIPTPAMSLEAC